MNNQDLFKIMKYIIKWQLRDDIHYTNKEWIYRFNNNLVNKPEGYGKFCFYYLNDINSYFFADINYDINRYKNILNNVNDCLDLFPKLDGNIDRTQFTHIKNDIYAINIKKIIDQIDNNVFSQKLYDSCISFLYDVYKDNLDVLFLCNLEHYISYDCALIYLNNYLNRNVIKSLDKLLPYISQEQQYFSSDIHMSHVSLLNDELKYLLIRIYIKHINFLNRESLCHFLFVINNLAVDNEIIINTNKIFNIICELLHKDNLYQYHYDWLFILNKALQIFKFNSEQIKIFKQYFNTLKSNELLSIL